jgi:hypothetical protein
VCCTAVQRSRRLRVYVCMHNMAVDKRVCMEFAKWRMYVCDVCGVCVAIWQCVRLLSVWLINLDRCAYAPYYWYDNADVHICS